ncbi:hypothetical protein DRQ25_07355 [Candidatus Fermentibacteria bacterium]|nr:MAG: hypothetical protein DRQ25_07355 [Candidatus Fermentibacteria bacterium]
MAKKEKTAPEKTDKTESTEGAAPFTLINYILFAAGLLDIIAGWFLLRGGHITIAPVMLIAGYCVIIPVAIIFRKKQPEAV